MASLQCEVVTAVWKYGGLNCLRFISGYKTNYETY